MFWQEQTTPREGPSNREKKGRSRLPKLKKRNPKRQLKRLPVPESNPSQGRTSYRLK
jgi:hypothetical protein